MSQNIGFLNDDFAIIASDSNITDEHGKSVSSMKKLFVGDNFVITSAGVSFGIDIIEGLIQNSDALGIKNIEDVESYLLTYGNSQYKTFIRNFKHTLKESLLRVYFLFAAFDSSNKVSLSFIGTEGDKDLEKIYFNEVITAPRRIVLEMQLAKIKNKKVFEISNFILDYLSRLSQIDDSLKSPFDLAIYDKFGDIKFMHN